MARASTDFLEAPPAAGHAVHVYEDVAELAGPVAAYLAAGFERGQPAVVVVTPAHWDVFADALAQLGWEPADVERRGLLALTDAEETLAAFMDNDGPSASRFEHVVGGLIDRVSARHPGRLVRAFGEMVDVLCRRGRADAAITLEDLWNDLARARSFSLLCGYRLDLFDHRAQVATLPAICRVHSHVRPSADPSRLTQAVDRALEDVLGPAQAGKIYLLIGDEAREERVPVPQLALMWVSRHMPVFAERVLAAARGYYGEPVTQRAA